MRTVINHFVNSSHIAPAEKEVLLMLVYEYTIEEMSLEIGIGQNQILQLQSGLLTKLEVQNTAGLIRVAYERGILQLCPS